MVGELLLFLVSWINTKKKNKKKTKKKTKKKKKIKKSMYFFLTIHLKVNSFYKTEE